MQTIDEARLESDIEYRYQFLCDFIGFTDEDVKTIQGLVVHLAPVIPSVVEQTYEKLLSYDATARHFVPRQHGYEGATPDSISDLSTNHEQIQFRKEHLTRYLMQLVGRAYDAKMIAYLDMVGKIHTPKAGNSAIDVPLVQMDALMGLISDILIQTITELNIEAEQKLGAIRAFSKLLWVQNDFIVRHY